ncbi:MAG: inositol monophosphatase [gamma proteobacterium symbiont of Bathyaustriella thionipta]|nr:inositol monophosphatase [gamma proteobacterium symbiont of Bathyaustriella thionipta]MCU7951782.1 inositol monophosphatase [gamma proteobacterium symbiont of Bathyaustriella thionipta]MCU7952407.1 inositol monophosphatase [gamma proteobacterium symbiont of Bathyaustriella thionipta]MCU7958383.1 inositol monophosphatase [gamma proteobacterium symbiont of Bathyaustriella thionipta]
MKLSQNNLDYLSQCAISAALQAGDIIRYHERNHVSHRLKQGADSLAAKIVTEVDLLAQEKILKSLSQSCQVYDLAILTEESVDDGSRLDKDFFWCIDPLDGTLYYSESEPGYSVSIALVSKSGESMLGVIYDPCEEKLYTAIKGQNSLINKIPVSSMFTEDKDVVTILCDRHSLQHKVYNEFIDELSLLLTKEGYQSTKILANGGAVKNAMGVLEHSPACYFKLPKEQSGGGVDLVVTTAIPDQIIFS